MAEKVEKQASVLPPVIDEEKAARKKLKEDRKALRKELKEQRKAAKQREAELAERTAELNGDDFNEPITDTARGILDGHIVLDRKLAQKNHYPAIDVLASISRCMSAIAPTEQKKAAGKLKNVLATYNDAEDLINIGAYKSGANKNIDYAVSKIDAVNDFLMQETDEKFTYEEVVDQLEKLFAN